MSSIFEQSQVLKSPPIKAVGNQRAVFEPDLKDFQASTQVSQAAVNETQFSLKVRESGLKKSCASAVGKTILEKSCASAVGKKCGEKEANALTAVVKCGKKEANALTAVVKCGVKVTNPLTAGKKTILEKSCASAVAAKCGEREDRISVVGIKKVSRGGIVESQALLTGRGVDVKKSKTSLRGEKPVIKKSCASAVAVKCGVKEANPLTAAVKYGEKKAKASLNVSKPSVKTVRLGADSKQSVKTVRVGADSKPSVKTVRVRADSNALKKLQTRADDVFQMAIRWRDDFTCITCGAKFPKGERTRLHAGHYISRRCLATRWDEENVNAQCRGCNLKQSLADVEIIHRYEVALLDKYGADVLERLFQKKCQKRKVTRAFLEELILTYTNFINRKKREG